MSKKIVKKEHSVEPSGKYLRSMGATNEMWLPKLLINNNFFANMFVYNLTFSSNQVRASAEKIAQFGEKGSKR